MLCFILCTKDANGSISYDEMEAGKAEEQAGEVVEMS